MQDFCLADIKDIIILTSMGQEVKKNGGSAPFYYSIKILKIEVHDGDKESNTHLPEGRHPGGEGIP